MAKYNLKEPVEAVLYTGKNSQEIIDILRSQKILEISVRDDNTVETRTITVVPNDYLISDNSKLTTVPKEQFEQKYTEVK
ncbi:hypothetical protein ThvES_00007880 [Thiovulum sp. ES]|nr:hypothetical protein ThvES_00007880 [Thiovulum sp. ES]